MLRIPSNRELCNVIYNIVYHEFRMVLYRRADQQRFAQSGFDRHPGESVQRELFRGGQSKIRIWNITGRNDLRGIDTRRQGHLWGTTLYNACILCSLIFSYVIYLR